MFQARDCEALEQVCIPIRADEVKLPYPACVVEFPDTYRRRYTDPANGECRPLFVVVCQAGGSLTGVVFGNMVGDAYKASVAVFGTGPGEEIDHFLVGSQKQGDNTPVIRAAINFLLLATNLHWTTRPHDKDRQDHLRKQIKHARRMGRGERVEGLQDKLRALESVTVCELDQSIRFFVREDPPEPKEPSGAGVGGWKTRMHWRRGHWRRVAVGFGRVERDWRFIAPVLVNGPRPAPGPSSSQTGG